MDGHAEVLRSLQGDKIGLLHIYHNPEDATKREKGLDRLFGCLLRGGKNQPVVQIPEKSDPVRVSLEDRSADLGRGRESETQGVELVTVPSDGNPIASSRNEEL